MTKEQLLFSLLRSEIIGESIALPDDSLTPELLEDMMNLAQYHTIPHLIADALIKNGCALPEPYKTQCEQHVLLALTNDARISYDVDVVRQLFGGNNIPFILLKGAVLRHLYDETWMRNSCDIDVLVKTEDLERAVAVLEEARYTVVSRGHHDVVLCLGKSRLELHFSLMEEGRAKKATDVLDDVWTQAICDGDGCEYRLPDDVLYFYHIAHMAKHMVNGGCGVRSFIDVYLLNHRVEFNKDDRRRHLEKGSLLTFANIAEHMAEVWFGNEQHTELSLETERYVLASGAYGNDDNRIAMTMIKYGGRKTYYLPRAFLPLRLMKLAFPILERYPILLPFLWVKRIFTVLFSSAGRKRIREEIHAVSRFDNNITGKTQKLMDNLDL